GGTTGDGGPSLPTGPIVFSRDSDADGTDDVVAVAHATGAVQTLLQGAKVRDLGVSPDGATVFVVRDASGGGTEGVYVSIASGTPRAIGSGASLVDLTVARSGNRVAVRAGTTWMVRPTDADGGIDVTSPAGAPLDFSPDGTRVALALPKDGGAE